MKRVSKKNGIGFLGVLFILVMYGFVNALFYSFYANSVDSGLTLVTGLILTAFGMAFGALAGVLLIEVNNARREGGPGSQFRLIMGRIGVVVFGDLPAAVTLAIMLRAENYSQWYCLGMGIFLSLCVGFICGVVLAPRK